MKKAKNKAKNHKGKIARNRKVSCGSNPTPRTTDEPTEFQHTHLSPKEPYFGFLNSFAPPISHTNSKPASINFLASFTVLATLQLP